ncbi:MFS transporter, partial [Candidatus Venteria ishoeyi]|uniref:MFS transporter n=1 Tax=Candidatus Venteria ishoeyi TaxID=1899563 RepID=UPI0011B095A4
MIKVKLGLTNSQIGILSVVQRLPSLFNPLVGIMADKFPVRYFVIVSPAITSITMSLIGLAPGVVIIGILLFVTGISSTLFHTPSPVMMKKVSGDKPGKGMSFYMLGGEFARTLGPLLITAAVSYWGLEGTWRLMPFGLVASFILFLRLRKIPIREDIQQSTSYRSFGKTLKATLPFFLILAGFMFFRGVAKAALTTFLTIYLDEQGQSLWFVNGALSIFQFT